MNNQPQNTAFNVIRHTGSDYAAPVSIIKQHALKSFLETIDGDYVFLRTHNGYDEYCLQEQRDTLLEALK